MKRTRGLCGFFIFVAMTAAGCTPPSAAAAHLEGLGFTDVTVARGAADSFTFDAVMGEATCTGSIRGSQWLGRSQWQVTHSCSGQTNLPNVLLEPDPPPESEPDPPPESEPEPEPEPTVHRGTHTEPQNPLPPRDRSKLPEPAARRTQHTITGGDDPARRVLKFLQDGRRGDVVTALHPNLVKLLRRSAFDVMGHFVATQGDLSVGEPTVTQDGPKEVREYRFGPASEPDRVILKLEVFEGEILGINLASTEKFDLIDAMDAFDPTEVELQLLDVFRVDESGNVVPSAQPSPPNHEVLWAYHITGLKADSEGQMGFEFWARIETSSGEFVFEFDPLEAPLRGPAKGRFTQWGGSFDMSLGTTGAYQLALSVEDVNTGAVVSWVEPFTVG